MKPSIQSQTDTTFIIIVAISTALLLIVTVLMIYFVIRYNKKRNPKPANIHGNTLLEVIWTVIPVILVLFIFFESFSAFKYMRKAPSDSMEITVTGQMWKWTFDYQNGKKTDTLYVPLYKPIKMLIKSLDVNHSFYLPYFRVKEDAIPGRTNYLWFQPDRLGRFTITCAEYCGLEHAYMQTQVVVMPEDEFTAWYVKPQDSTAAPKDSVNKNPADTLKK